MNAQNKKETEKEIQEESQIEGKRGERASATDMIRKPSKMSGGAANKEGNKTMNDRKDRITREGKITEYYGNEKKNSEEETDGQRVFKNKEEKIDEQEVVLHLKEVKEEVRKMIKNLKTAFVEDKKKRRTLVHKELEEWKKFAAEEKAEREEEYKKERELWKEVRKVRENEITKQKESWDRDFELFKNEIRMQLENKKDYTPEKEGPETSKIQELEKVQKVGRHKNL